MTVKNIANECEIIVSSKLSNYHHNYLIDGKRGDYINNNYWNSSKNQDSSITINLKKERNISKIVLKSPILASQFTLSDIYLLVQLSDGKIFKYGSFQLKSGSITQVKDILLDINKDKVRYIYIFFPKSGANVDGYVFLGSIELYEGVFPYKLEECLQWLDNKSIEAMKETKRLMDDGTSAYPPQAGINYNAFWCRDYAMIIDGIKEKFNNNDLKEMANIFVKYQRNDGAFLDKIGYDYTPYYMPGFGSVGTNPVQDGTQYTTDIIYNTYLKTKDKKIILNSITQLVKGMNFVQKDPDDNILVYTNDSTYPNKIDRAPFGFTDLIYKTGRLLISSILYYKSCLQLSEMYKIIDKNNESSTWNTNATNVKNKINEKLWNDNDGLYYATDIKNKQSDIVGSCMAVYYGVADGLKKNKICLYMLNNYNDLVKWGSIRYLKKNEYWQFTSVAQGSYQNGAYWPTFTGYYAYCLNELSKDKCDQLIREMVEYFIREGIYEYIIESEPQGFLDKYNSSICLPIKHIKNILLKRK